MKTNLKTFPKNEATTGIVLWLREFTKELQQLLAKIDTKRIEGWAIVNFVEKEIFGE